MRFRQGAQAEVLLSLALVMVTGTGLLAALFLEIEQARVERLHGLLGHGFVASVGDCPFREFEEAVCELGGAAFRLVLPIQGRSPERIAKTAPREAEVREPNAID